jgi:hypothetical protein
MEHTGFPSEETLAAFIDGRLDPETRRRVVEHMANCTECYETFLGASDWSREAQVLRMTSTSRFGNRAAMAAAAVFGIAASALFVVGPIRRWHDSAVRDRGMAALALEANELSSRTLVARLSGGFAYRPIMRGGNRDNEGETEKISVLALQRADASGAGDLHVFGAANLLLGHTDDAVRALDRAITKETGQQILSEAIRASDDVALLSDLSAAHYQRYVSKHSLTDLQVSLKASERSWFLAKTPEAAWNHALALEANHEREAARLAWRDYFLLDRGSPWASEATSRLSSLDEAASKN